MVDPIKGSGQKIIITKPQAKEVQGKKDGNFDKVFHEKNSPDASSGASAPPRSNAEANLALLDQQNLARMQKLETISRQIREGTYQGVDPKVLAQKLLDVMFDKKIRDKFKKKLLNEEIESAKTGSKLLSDLELKKLVFMIKSTQDEGFEDPELEKLLKDLS